MARLHRTAAAALVTCLLLGATAACNDQVPPPGGADKGAASKKRPAAPYAVTLAFADVGGSGGETPTPAPGEPMLITVTNRGTKADTFILQLRPTANGGVSPAGVALKPGAAAQVRVVLLPGPDDQDGVSLVAISRATKQEVGSLDLPAPKAE